jgi:MGT family glycosyltransferase
MRGDVTLLLTSAELHPKSPLFDDPSFAFLGPAIDPKTRLENFDFGRLNDRPLIYVSLGTLHFSNDRFFELCMEAFADYPAQFLLSAGRGSDIGRFRHVPGNFIIADSVPQLAVLERASLFITHGGLNSLHESLWFGVPMVMVPQQFEQLRNALTAGRGGAAIVLDDECYRRHVTPEALRAAVDKIMSSPAFRTAARELGRSLHEAGGFKAAASQIEAVAAASGGRVH